MAFLLFVAFISGILTVFSPCVLPVLPIVLASGADGNKNRVRGVIVGLVLSFTIATLILATIISALGISVDSIRMISVLALIALGIILIFDDLRAKVQTFFETHWKFESKNPTAQNFLGGFIAGFSLGIVWTPCIGPIIATVATLAAVNSFSIEMVLITLAYTIGTGITLYIVSQGSAKIMSKLGFVKNNLSNINKVFGFIVLFTAFFIYSGADKALQAYTLQNLPGVWTQITTTFEKAIEADAQIQNLRN